MRKDGVYVSSIIEDDVTAGDCVDGGSLGLVGSY